MSQQEFEQIQADLKEIKEMMKVISRQVSADQEVAAVRALRRAEEDRVSLQIRQMATLAD